MQKCVFKSRELKDNYPKVEYYQVGNFKDPDSNIDLNYVKFDA